MIKTDKITNSEQINALIQSTLLGCCTFCSINGGKLLLVARPQMARCRTPCPMTVCCTIKHNRLHNFSYKVGLLYKNTSILYTLVTRNVELESGVRVLVQNQSCCQNLHHSDSGQHIYSSL